MCVLSGEDIESYDSALRSIINILETLYPNQETLPQYIMSDFCPAISSSIDQVCPQTVQLKCNFHFGQLLNPKLTNKEYFPERVILAPSTIPSIYRDYFNAQVFLNSKRTNFYSPARIIKYDIAILTKLPTKILFEAFFNIITPFWQKYCPKFHKVFKEEYLEGMKKSGWQYYLSNCLPKTNNNVETYNRTIKDFVTKRKAESFSSYFELMKKEVIDKSQITETLPCCPNVFNNIYKLGAVLAKNFYQLYFKFNDCYFIKDKFPNYSFLNKNKKGLKTHLKNVITKIGIEAQTTSNFRVWGNFAKISRISRISRKSKFLKILSGNIYFFF